MKNTPQSSAVHRLQLALLGAVFAGSAIAAEAPPKVWKSSSFLERVDGTLADGGANMYVAADGSIRLIHVNDLNHDGHLDLVAPTDHSQSDGRVDLSIFWGKSGVAPQPMTRLPSDRGKATAAVNLNGDGYPDLVVANSGSNASRVPIDSGQTSYIYWGSDKGFSPGNRTELLTQNAYAVAIADLDADGSPDLVFANIGNTISADHHKKSYVYWGDKGRYEIAKRAVLPTEKATDVKVADVNGDGFPDVLISQEGNLPSAGGVLIYWGGAAGRAALGRELTRLPGDSSSALAVGDLNGDGQPEIVVAHEYRSKGREAWGIYTIDNEVQLDSYINWGSKEGYSTGRRTALPTLKATGVAIGDLNGDGRPDVVFANCSGGVGYGSYSAGSKPGAGESYVYWNGPDGFAAHRRLALPASYANACTVADVNQDGHLDIVVANLFDPRSAPGPGQPVHAFGGSPQGNALIYWGGPDGYAAAQRQVLPAIGLEDVAVADFNNDGFLDFAASHYSGSLDRKHPSYLFWNGPDGFAPDRVTLLPTNAASGVMTADFNNDGYQDIRFANHVKDSDHYVSNFIYWGAKTGFAENRRSEIYNPGPHLLSGRDIGNIYNRSDRYDYVSPPFDAGPASRFGNLTWEGETPFRTRLEFQVKTAATRDELICAVWSGPAGPGSYFQKFEVALQGAGATVRWIQYKATLVSPNDVNTPVLRAVSVSYR